MPYTVSMPRGERFVRLTALGLLLLASVDLGAPGLCEAERPSESTAIHLGWAEPHSDVSESDVPGAWVDDCFCCCAHLIPPPRRTLATAARVDSAFAVPLEGTPRGRQLGLFHPPRA